MTTFGFVVFDDAEELDFVGPWEVFAAHVMLAKEGSATLIAEHERPVRCAKGMRVVPDVSFASAPDVDVLVVPGGMGTRRELRNPVMIDYLRKAGARAAWVTSVCTGSLLLHEAGFARNKNVTTHHSVVEALRARGDVTVHADRRWVVDGNLVTAAGVSAGIDMALWLVGQLASPEVARAVQRYIEYHPAPPYAE